ncbi:aminoglycoside phosphotransferase family protein [Candidatus Woesearchaeota archaeon]|nr:aminoglycoside phosphotransferase family protein [Candidatus Woesearchaeota archaeon]
MNLAIGVDFDNTIVSYDALMHKVALEKGFISRDARKSKKSIRDSIRKLENGEEKWQLLQAAAYGQRMNEANLISGVRDFFRNCNEKNIKAYIISHKTEFADYDKTKTNLRYAAMGWMERNSFFREDGLGISKSDVFFEPTREDKINRIKKLGCTHYIDDLEETFSESSFPKEVKKILYDSHDQHPHLSGVGRFGSWSDINEYFFGENWQVLDGKLPLISKLLGKKVVSIENIKQGKNSRVHIINCRDSRFILKAYFSHEMDKRDRLETEFSSLKFLRDNKVECVPQPIKMEKDSNFAIYEFIEGNAVDSSKIKEEDLDYAIEFLKRLDRLKAKKESKNFPRASEACFSIKEIADNLESRYDRLKTVDDKELHEFLGRFHEALIKIIGWSRKESEKNGIGYGKLLEEENRTLSPSDFGFHNSIRKNGRIIFLDFEYFGWDDPAKAISDFVLHPNMSMTHEFKEKFVRDMVSYFSKDKELKSRLKIVFPLFGLKWCLIMLNEFLDEHLSRRAFASGKLLKEEAKAEQLSKAKSLLDQINKNYNDFPYGLE